MSAAAPATRRPSFSSLLTLGLAVGLTGVLLQQTGTTTVAALGITSVIAILLAVVGLATRSSAGEVLTGVALPVAAVTGLGAILVAVRAAPPVTLVVIVFAVGGCWLLGYAIFGQRGQATLGTTAKKLAMMATVAGAAAILSQVGLLGLLAPAAMLFDAFDAVLAGPELVQLALIVADILVIIVAVRLAAGAIRRYEASFLPGTTRIRVGNYRLTHLLTRGGLGIGIASGIGIGALLLVATVAGSPEAATLLRGVRQGIVTARTQALFAGLLAIGAVGYVLVRLATWIDSTDLTGAVGRGGQFLGSVGLGIAATLGLPRYAPFVVDTPLENLPATTLPAAIAAGPLLAVALLLVGVLFALLLLSRPTARGLAGAGSAGLFIAAPLAALAVGSPLLSFGGVALAIIVWDLQETGIGIREDLGTAQLVPRNELLRAGGSIVVGALSIGVAWGVHSQITTGTSTALPPLVALAVLGGMALLVLYIVRRTPSTGADVGD